MPEALIIVIYIQSYNTHAEDRQITRVKSSPATHVRHLAREQPAWYQAYQQSGDAHSTASPLASINEPVLLATSCPMLYEADRIAMSRENQTKWRVKQ